MNWPPALPEERIGHTPRRRTGESVAVYVRRMRAALDRSVRDVAEDSGVPRATVSAVETGAMRPGRRTAEALADALGFDPSEIAA